MKNWLFLIVINALSAVLNFGVAIAEIRTFKPYWGLNALMVVLSIFTLYVVLNNKDAYVKWKK